MWRGREGARGPGVKDLAGVAGLWMKPRFPRMASPTDGPGPSPRSPWPVRLLAQGEASGDDLSASTTAEERIAMVWELSRRMWLLTGRPWPRTSREALPIQVSHRA